MFAEVIIDMQNPNALCTVGILSALLESGSKDYSDLISPFILTLAARTEGQEVDISSIQKSMRDNYGFDDMPLDFIRGVLNRHSKQGGYFKINNRQYFCKKIFDGQSLIDEQKRMREKINYVIQQMQLYFAENYVYEQLSAQVVKDMLESFFQSCGFAMARNINNLYEVSAHSYGKEVFWVARFVLDSMNQHLLEEEYLLEMVKGFLICKALYYFENDNKSSFSSKLKNVSCFLDCSLVISALGYNSKERENEVRELIHLIRDNGGRVYVLEHTVSEAESLLKSFAQHPHSINSFQLDGLASKQYTKGILLAVSSSIKSNLKEKHGIDIIPNPEYTPENYSGVQDESRIIQWLEECRKNNNRGRFYSRDRFGFDAKSLSSIGILRKGYHPQKIEHCKAILVTQDPFLSSCMKNLYPKNFPPEINFAILDVDLASLLWLSRYNAKSTLPIDILISNAVSLNIASPEILERAFELTDKLVEDETLSEDAALMIRCQPRMKKYLGEATQNDSAAVSDITIKMALDKYIEAESSKRIENATSKYKNQLELERERNKKYKSEKSQLLLACNEKAQQIADRLSNLFETTLLGISFLILIASTLIWVFKFFCDYTPLQSAGLHALFVILDILSLLQIIDFFRNQNGFIKKSSRRLNDWLYTQSYSYLVGKAETSPYARNNGA